MNLSPNRRIALNIIVSYGRSIFGLICGLLTGRWALMALGEVDYGLSSLIGGLVVFITFINGLMAGAVGRFYAYAVGESQNNIEEGLSKSRQWFNSAILIHTILPTILLVIGYPIGEYAVRYWLTIPSDRIQACVWVWRIVCCSCYMGMITVPFTSFYYAKQYLIEPTLYSTLGVLLNALFLYYMVEHPGDWLVASVLWTCLLTIAPEIIMAIRACLLFPECKFNYHDLWSWQRTKGLLNYAGWMMFGAIGAMSKNQLLAILVNKNFGPAVNAAMSVANHVSAKTTVFSGGMIGSFQPAIVNACGAKDFVRMKKLAFMTCKFGTMLTILFALPIALELPEIMKIWLKNPPQYTVGLCWCILLMVVIDQTAVGHMLAVNANGKIALYQAVLGTSLILTFPVAWVFIKLGLGVYSVGYALVLTMTVCALGRVIFACYLVQMSFLHWIYSIIIPLLIFILIGGSIGLLPRLFMPESFIRVIVTGCITEIALSLTAWFVLLNKEERNVVTDKIAKIKRKFGYAQIG